MTMNTIHSSEDIGTEGHLCIVATPKGSTTRFCLYSGLNKIMDEAKAFVLSSIYDAAFVPDPITYFKVGNGGTATLHGSDAKVVTGDRTDLFDPLTAVYTNTVTAPALTELNKVATFSFSIPETDLDGEYINEVGMFRNSGAMFNMKTFPSILKTTGFSLTFIWTVRHK